MAKPNGAAAGMIQPGVVVPPHNALIEYLMLGYILLEPECLAPAMDAGLTRECFYVERNAQAFEAVSALVQKGSGVTVEAVVEAMGVRFDLSRMEFSEWRTYLHEAMAKAYHNTPADVSVRGHVESLRNLRLRRALCDHAARTVHDASRLDCDIAEVMEGYESRALRLETGVERQEKGAGRLAMDELKAIDSNKERKVNYLRTGFRDIDDRLVIDPPFVVVIAGYPSSGKTAWALNIMLNLWRQGVAGTLFSIDNSEKQVRRRLISIQGGPPVERMLRPETLGEADRAAAMKAAEDLYGADKDIRVNFSSKITPGVLQAGMQTAIKINPRARYFIVDYLQLMDPGGDRKRNETRERDVASVMSECKSIARRLGLLAVILSQLRKPRDAKDGAIPPPNLGDLRDTGQIWQDADAVILLHKMGENQIEANLAKNKDGKLVRAQLHFAGEWMRFSGMDVRDYGGVRSTVDEPERDEEAPF